ncbi:hypothetical protein ABVT39_006561 [Epinephelus coioides]
MPSGKGRHASCSVASCNNQDKSLFAVPTEEEVRTQWISFIFDGNPPGTVPKILHVCAKHFAPESFSNLFQFQSGFATKLWLNVGAIPTLREPPSTSEERPAKRPREEMEEEEEDPFEGTSSMAESRGEDVTCDPASSVSVSLSTDMS